MSTITGRSATATPGSSAGSPERGRPGAPGDEIVANVRRGWESIRPFSTGGNYVNFQLADDDKERTAAAYGGNFARLRRAKATYDPDNLFRTNRNITPAA